MYKKISIVTVSYNMVDYIEETILSVINQNYPNLEYIIIDGGSTDGTVEIIKKYIDKIFVFVSEPDSGMYNALAKGFKYATGDIYAWINADDSYLPWTFKLVNQFFCNFPNIRWISGLPAFMNEDRVITDIFPFPGAKHKKDIMQGRFQHNVMGCIQQEGMFWQNTLYYEVGGINDNFKYAGDFELWTRFAQKTDLISISVPLAMFMRRGEGLSINGSNKYEEEVKRICKKMNIYPSCIWRWGRKSKMVLLLLRILFLRNAPVLFYSLNKKKFVLKKLRRSISYHTLQSLFLYYNANK